MMMPTAAPAASLGRSLMVEEEPPIGAARNNASDEVMQWMRLLQSYDVRERIAN